MTKRYLLAAVATIACLAQPALAQDSMDDTSGTSTRASDDWTGVYIGARAGIANRLGGRNEQIEFDTNLDGTFGDTVRTSAGANAFSPGFCGGLALSAGRNNTAQDCRPDSEKTEWNLHIGYDYDFGPFVAGIVGEYGRSNVRDSVSAFSTTPANYVLTRQLRRTLGLRGRLGFDLDGTMIYGTGGAAYGRVRERLTSTNVANDFTTTEDEDYELGYRYGAGVEHNVGGRFSIGALYLLTNFDFNQANVRVTRGRAPATNPFVITNTGGTDFRRTRDEVRQHSISVVGSLRF